MLLTLPPQTAPNSDSFPQNREAVRNWLSELSPRSQPEDAAELLRGLRHSNRLSNDSDVRRAVLDEFRPTLNRLTKSLAQTIAPQPLPMARQFRHAAALLDELLREEANAWKILLVHSPEPEIQDAKHAMLALFRQATAAVQQYRMVPSYCLRDANQIYAQADSEGLLTKRAPSSHKDNASIADLLQAYAGILILSTIDLRQIRARQLDLTLIFLADQRSKVSIQTNPESSLPRKNDRIVDLSSFHGPMPAASFIGDHSNPSLRWINFNELVESIDHRLSRTRTTLSMTLGADTLERQTLMRLSQSLAGSRSRQNARRINYQPVELAFGHQQISNQLLRTTASEPDKENDSEKLNDKYLNDKDTDWSRLNVSSKGAAFRSSDPKVGTAQVGELVAITEPDRSTTLSVVRWVHASDDGTLSIGVEYLSNGVMAVTLTRDTAEEGVTDEALIIACRIEGKATQTILLPGYRFNTGDRLTARQAEKRKQIKLGQCLQSNGMFSQFVLSEG